MVKEKDLDGLFTPETKQAYTQENTKKKGGRPHKPEGTKKDHKFLLTLKKQDYEELKEYSQKIELSINEFVRLAVKQYIKNGERPSQNRW